MINNRQQGRRRGRGNGPQRPGGGGQGQRDSGNRIDSRARGNAAQLLEKYKNMARDAQMSGDRVNTEYYLQFADHYFRVLADQRGRNEDQGQQRRQQRDDFDQFDPFDDFGDEGEPVRADEMQRAQEGDRQGGERQQSDRQQNDRPQNDRQYGDRQYGERSARDDRPRSDRDDRQRDDRQRDSRDERQREGREDRQQRQPREERPRFDRDRRPVEARDDERRFQRPTQAPVANDVDTPPSEAPAPNAAPAQDLPPVSDVQAEEAPRRRTRTRKPREDAGDTAAPAEALGADRLPPALGLVPSRQDVAARDDEDVPAPAGDDAAAEAPKPRRRRIVRAASGEATPAE
ncbi:DUF4167 domain-containing protein [uncultured Sphingomonas sp.]|uniref:DUF4167 domain-containing protein n=1 Tax=uncultured Sphingomonas sp. TaxID=158754 RepID=UPI00260DB368|nr:DUF4167 domain-containing protein [uncultured Sphingomonas sp.]